MAARGPNATGSPPSTSQRIIQAPGQGGQAMIPVHRQGRGQPKGVASINRRHRIEKQTAKASITPKPGEGNSTPGLSNNR